VIESPMNATRSYFLNPGTTAADAQVRLARQT
jgi:hypothetical protein